ncbi:hypothetical protein GCM10014719_49930 [Planomonospora parontospora subsp. antibiotica]|nr:hypothetical protein GCM10014719_49930 [Planomonospora parontospora subsp. antibiotica]GII18368.1 hypothetical protein Ppa05_50940 [Planomonospora parontospora subsp. antibiotica]
MTARLARELITACTRLGDLVVDLYPADHVLTSSALRLGRHTLTVTTGLTPTQTIGRSLALTHPAEDLRAAELHITHEESTDRVLAHYRGRAALVVLAHTAGPARRLDDEPTETSLLKAAELLRSGGHLGVVTGLHREDGHLYDPAPELIRQAQQVGLVYLQHIVALHATVRHGQITVPPLARCTASRASGAGAVPVSVRVHSDVLLFTKPITTACDVERAS